MEGIDVMASGSYIRLPFSTRAATVRTTFCLWVTVFYVEKCVAAFVNMPSLLVKQTPGRPASNLYVKPLSPAANSHNCDFSVTRNIKVPQRRTYAVTMNVVVL